MHAVIRRGLDHAQALALALIVHLLAIALIVVGTMNWQPFREITPAGLTIEAVIIDTAVLQERRLEAEQAVRREEQRERRERQMEQQRQRERDEAEVQRQQDLERQQREAADRRQEQLRLQQLRDQQELERQEQIERQQREIEELRQQRERLERERLLEEERLKQLESRRQREVEAQEAVEAEAQRQAAAEAAVQAERMGTSRERYETAIRSQVTRNWLRPPTAQPGLRCILKVVQIPGGEVISAEISGTCSADEATRRSLVGAVQRAGSLPYRGFEEVFERELEFVFGWDGD